MSNQTTPLASSLINGHDRLTIELVEPPDMPTAVLLRWPEKASITTPATYSNVAAVATQVLAAAVVEWGRSRSGGGYKNWNIRTPGAQPHQGFWSSGVPFVPDGLAPPARPSGSSHGRGQLARAPSRTPRRRVKARPSAIMPTPSTR